MLQAFLFVFLLSVLCGSCYQAVSGSRSCRQGVRAVDAFGCAVLPQAAAAAQQRSAEPPGGQAVLLQSASGAISVMISLHCWLEGI